MVNIALTISIHRMTDSIYDIEKLTILIYDVKITKYHKNKQSPCIKYLPVIWIHQQDCLISLMLLSKHPQHI